MKNFIKKNTLSYISLFLLIFSFIFINGCTNSPIASEEETMTKGETMIIRETSIPDTWWANFARFTNNGITRSADAINADAITVLNGFHDEGIGEFAYRNFYAQNTASQVNQAKEKNIKVMAWLELMGEARTIIGSVNNLGDGKYEIDPVTGAPRLIANYWTWGVDGYGVNDKSNQIIWMGSHSWANRETWNGPYVMPESHVIPTYPDGRSALGLMDGKSVDDPDPRNYKFYDALACKSVFGTFVEQEQYPTPNFRNTNGFLDDPLLNGNPRLTGDYYFSRDISAQWWIEYNRNAVKNALQDGADGFWVDNYTGWGYLGNQPIYRAFGDWSVANFNEYLKQNPIEGIDPANFNIREYIVNQAKKDYPSLDTSTITYQTAARFQNTKWLEDEVWMHFLAFKSFEISKHTHEFYTMVKEEAKKAGHNPDDILVSGNDVALLHNAALDKNDLDIVHSEYNPHFSAVTADKSDKLLPDGYSGPHYKYLTQLSKSGRGSVWYYLGGAYEAYQNNPELAKVLSFEALASNCTINSGNGINSITGDNNSAKFVNDIVGELRENFRKREIVSSVAMYYSSNSELSQLTPGGYISNGSIPSTLGYYGWATSFEKMQIPYETITESDISLLKLQHVNVLVLANITSISKDTVDKILKPYLDSGKTMIITGLKAGERDTRENNYKKHSNPILVDLAKNYTGNGKIIYYEIDPAYNAYSSKNYSSTMKIIQKALSDFQEVGMFMPDVIIEKIDEAIILATHYDFEKDRMFLDLSNRNIDLATDTVRKTDKSILKVKSPIKFGSDKVKIRIWSVNDDGITEKEINADITDEYVKIEIPEFLYYTSVMIEEDLTKSDISNGTNSQEKSESGTGEKPEISNADSDEVVSGTMEQTPENINEEESQSSIVSNIETGLSNDESNSDNNGQKNIDMKPIIILIVICALAIPAAAVIFYKKKKQIRK